MSIAPESALLVSCSFDGSPPLNTDIAGLGVRISTYVQAFLAVILLTVSSSPADIYSQAIPLVIMNIAIMTTGIILGFSKTPQITLQDAIVVWYFTIIALVILHVAGMKLQRRKKSRDFRETNKWDRVANLVSASAMYILSAVFTLGFLRHHETFGSQPECNDAARLFIFGTFPVTRAWFIFMAVIYAILLFFLFIALIVVVSKLEERQEAKDQQQLVEDLVGIGNEVTPDFTPEYRWGAAASVLLAVWVAFTEITVIKNRFAPPDGPIWQFGQIFPLILLAVPLFITAKGVSEWIDGGATRSSSPQDLENGGNSAVGGSTNGVELMSDQHAPEQASERKSVDPHSADTKEAEERSESDIFGLPNGLAPAPTGFFGLGLGFGCRSKPKPADRLGKPVCRLGKPVCSLSTSPKKPTSLTTMEVS
ncbi:hypothetical protein MSAN_00242000 [Mycena sanguinolenta]|uniref:Uncharacterized protein n=1 Tax=Mycena sanguinolenta TaxID=230812 RepID=A0A8H7DL59_9AGAR|nr:hypothetical protein MSAN_00242000 [Mycena sanguinolenta]